MNPTPPSESGSLTRAAIGALVLDTTPWLSCEDCFEHMDTHVEALLRDPDHHDLAMGRHLQGCAACQEEVQSLRALLTAEDTAGRGNPGPEAGPAGESGPLTR